jgi:plasmid stability protein
MPQLLIPDVGEALLRHLQQRASSHGRTAEAEARMILAEALQPTPPKAWAHVNAIREQLAASGRAFSDSTDLLREDRDR